MAFPDHDTLILNLVGNRYCENIKRQHKSNNVMLIMDFQRGVSSEMPRRRLQRDESAVTRTSRGYAAKCIKSGRALPFERGAKM